MAHKHVFHLLFVVVLFSLSAKATLKERWVHTCSDIYLGPSFLQVYVNECITAQRTHRISHVLLPLHGR